MPSHLSPDCKDEMHRSLLTMPCFHWYQSVMSAFFCLFSLRVSGKILFNYQDQLKNRSSLKSFEIAVDFQQGNDFALGHSGDIWQCVELFFLIILLGWSGVCTYWPLVRRSPGSLGILQCTKEPPTVKDYQPEMSILPRLRKPLLFWLSFHWTILFNCDPPVARTLSLLLQSSSTSGFQLSQNSCLANNMNSITLGERIN